MTFESHEYRVRTEASLLDYFRRRLDRCAEQMHLAPHDDTLWYLGTLLERFGRSEQLFEYHEGRQRMQALALLYRDAYETTDQRLRCQLLQRLGDLALFIGAFFPERYARRGIRRDYFVGMGGGAYDYLSEHLPRQRHIFGELTRQFGRMIELVAKAGTRSGRLGPDEILSLYARWVETGSPTLAAQLRSLGIQLPATGRAH